VGKRVSLELKHLLDERKLIRTRSDRKLVLKEMDVAGLDSSGIKSIISLPSESNNESERGSME